MNCYYHPNREIVGKCKNCGRLICDECRVPRGGKTYCILCADAPAARTTAHENLSWFEKHLNWAVALGWLAASTVFFLMLMIGLSNIRPSLSSSFYKELRETVYGASTVIYLGIITGAWVWALKKKHRSLWWLLLGIFVPFGWVVLMLLENRSEM